MRYLKVAHLNDDGKYIHKMYEQGEEYTHFVADQNGIDIYKNDFIVASFDMDKVYYFKMVDTNVIDDTIGISF